MENEAFTLAPQKAGRMKYLLITMLVPILVPQVYKTLVSSGILTGNQVTAYIVFAAWMAMMWVLSYFLIFQKNHVIRVEGSSITVTDWRQKTVSIRASEIASVRRNFLKEIILLDENGKKLLSVESYMTNFQLFESWLEKHNIA